MGFPTREASLRRVGLRAALIGVMLGGGLLTAGISQAQDIAASDANERLAEAVAAAGGPVQTPRLIPFAADRAAVDVREDDVAPSGATDLAGAAPSATAQPVSEALPSSPEPTARQIARAETTEGSTPRR